MLYELLLIANQVVGFITFCCVCEILKAWDVVRNLTVEMCMWDFQLILPNLREFKSFTELFLFLANVVEEQIVKYEMANFPSVEYYFIQKNNITLFRSQVTKSTCRIFGQSS